VTRPAPTGDRLRAATAPLGVSRGSRTGGVGKGKAVAGLILGVFALVFYVVVGLFTLGLGWFV
jgi:hypothetical protein